MNRLLITGARGFIGRHCIQPALEAGYEVHGTVSSKSVPDDLKDLPVKWHTSDLLAPDACDQLIHDIRPSHVLHTAWVTAHGDYWESPDNLLWVAASAKLIHAFAEQGGKRFVTVGSCAEYDWANDIFNEDTTPENPATLYGEAKLAVSRILMAAARTQEFSAANGRIFFGYGPYENEKRIIPYACQTLARQEIASFASGQLLRDFMHVSDIGRGMVALLQSDIAGGCNISSGEPVRLADIVEIIGKQSGHPDLVKLGAFPDRAGDPPLLVGDNRKLLATGWTQEISLQEGLAQTYKWWQENKKTK